jgi:hypothetical protein
VALLTETARGVEPARTITAHLCEGAFEAVIAGDVATHDKAVAAGLTELAAKSDVVVLAQASMARVVEAMGENLPKVPVLASPALAMEAAREALGRI